MSVRERISDLLWMIGLSAGALVLAYVLLLGFLWLVSLGSLHRWDCFACS